MRRTLGYVLLALSGLLLTLAVVAVTWAPGAIKKTPLDVSSRTVYEGEGAKLDTATNAFDLVPVYAVQVTKSDSENSMTSTSSSWKPLPGRRHRRGAGLRRRRRPEPAHRRHRRLCHRPGHRARCRGPQSS